MWEKKERYDGMVVHKVMCDYEGCQRRTFEVMHKDADDFQEMKGWLGRGPRSASHISELKHYCKQHNTI